MTPFHALHQSGLLILPNVWDGGSAAIVREAGARALATTSAGVAWALGWPDGDVLPVDRLVQAAADIVRAARGLPVSIDMEGGYSDDPAEIAALATRLVEAGAQGINIEDGGGTPEALGTKIAAIRAAVGDALFINARCDVWLRGLAPDAPVAEAARRAGLYADAGADGFFAPGLTDTDDIAHMVAATPLPLNLMARPTLPDATTLEALGVRRLSAGSGLAQATLGRAAAVTRAFLTDGRSTPLSDEALDYGKMNGWMS
ncbi:MAG: isocitrate lyase/PEP mutase family protein [Brevundimonas sp.]|uniref:isocitrate lyase/PEP mutase family protein n=1 Tax=Brevundimonas sp. TaxID=1871086 RepID=UPI00403370FC